MNYREDADHLVLAKLSNVKWLPLDMHAEIIGI